MVILGALGIADKRLINLFLDDWWNFDNISYKVYHRKHNAVGEDMIQGLKFNDRLIYEFILLPLEGYYGV